jgi:cysteine-rich repeat protein
MPEIDVAGYDSIHLQFRRWLTTEDSNRDRASILADGAQLWSNLATPTGQADHRDIEWVFQDVDLTPLSGNGVVEVAFQLTADSDRELGGWNLDDVCVVAAGAPVCGDGRQTLEETCDDGNDSDGDGCSATCQLEEDGDPGCCSTGRSNRGGAGALALATLTIFVLIRRRRA